MIFLGPLSLYHTQPPYDVPTHNSTLVGTSVPLYSHNNGSFMTPGHLLAINITGLEEGAARLW